MDDMTFLMGCLEYRAYKIFSEESLQKWDDLSDEEQNKYRMKAVVEVSNKHSSRKVYIEKLT